MSCDTHVDEGCMGGAQELKACTGLYPRFLHQKTACFLGSSNKQTIEAPSWNSGSKTLPPYTARLEKASMKWTGAEQELTQSVWATQKDLCSVSWLNGVLLIQPMTGGRGLHTSRLRFVEGCWYPWTFGLRGAGGFLSLQGDVLVEDTGGCPLLKKFDSGRTTSGSLKSVHECVCVGGDDPDGGSSSTERECSCACH